MNRIETARDGGPFHGLLPDTILTTVEKALEIRCSNLCRPLNSYINRVYELEDEQGNGLIAKFYRPGRWSEQALQDEHDFVNELAAEEVPVVAPLMLKDHSTLGRFGDLFFALFPKRSGRSYDEYSDDQWLELGRLIGRTHMVGERHLPRERITIAPHLSTREQVDYILRSGFIDADLARDFSALTERIIDHITPLFTDAAMLRIHGDCHFANLIYRPSESFYIIDFDDMSVGPAVQDFWMLLPHYMEKSFIEIDMFLEGYETFRSFDRRTLRLIEPLRAMRYIHYTAWCAHQVKEDGVSRVMPDFGTRHYWMREIKDLTEQLERILDASEVTGNF